MAAVDLLDENRSVLKKSDWPLMGGSIQIFGLESYEFSMIKFQRARAGLVDYDDNYGVQDKLGVYGK